MFEIVENKFEVTAKLPLERLNVEVAGKVIAYHRTFPVYQVTPLCELKSLAEQLGVRDIYVKDESHRFDLNAFKVLGGSYAIGNYVAGRLGIPMEELTYQTLVSEETKKKLGDITFVSATDGNHGRGVAWTAKQMNQTCKIFLPKGTADERIQNIRATGATAVVTELNYDDTVRHAYNQAMENGWILLQDTSWEGYEDIPTHIMQGYMTLGVEILGQLDGVKPTHVFLQAGVGALSTSITGLLLDYYGDDKPMITIVEPNKAACIFKTIKAADGKVHHVTGDLNTIMAGLACGEPITIGIDILRKYADYFISGPDYAAAEGMRVLSSPMGGDPRIIAGESGAAGFGMAYVIITDESLKPMKEKLGIDQNSILLFINTEGATDRVNYKHVVWDGSYPNHSTRRHSE